MWSNPTFPAEVRSLGKRDLVNIHHQSQSSGYSPLKNILLAILEKQSNFLQIKKQRRPFLELPFWPQWREGPSSWDLVGISVGKGVRSFSYSQWCYFLAIELVWMEREQDDSVVLWCVRWTLCNLMKIVWWEWVYYTSSANTRWWKRPPYGPLGGWGVEAAGKYLLFCLIPCSGACGTADGLLLISHAACLQWTLFWEEWVCFPNSLWQCSACTLLLVTRVCTHYTHTHCFGCGHTLRLFHNPLPS